MKKINILLSILVLILPLKVNAEKLNITINCPKEVAPESIISCDILTKNQTPINGLKLKYSLNNNLIYKKTTLENNWNQYYLEKDGIVITKPQNEDLEENIAKLYIQTPPLNTGNNKYTISLYEIEASDINYNLLTSDNISAEIKVLSDDNTLSSLIIENAKLKTPFNKNKLTYEGETTKDTINIKVTPTDSNAKISGNIGVEQVSNGSNIYKITVTSALGNIRTYTIIIVKDIPKPAKNSNNNSASTPILNNDASLKNIQIKGYYVPFEKNKYNYELKIPNNITTIDITATPSNSLTKVNIDKPSSLIEGDNYITITTTAEDGTTCKYTINIIRKKLSNDTTIKKIIIENYNLKIKNNLYEYKLKIKEENKLNIKVILNDDASSYKINGNNNLETGSIITITVTAEDKTQSYYTIKIIKDKNSTSNYNLFNNTNLLIVIAILIIITTTITLYRKRILKQ